MNALAARLPPVPAPLPPIPPAPIGTVPHFGFLPDPFGPVVSCEPLPWPALAATVTMHAPGGKEGAAWMPARIEPGPRKTARVQAISALVMDVEAATETVKDAQGHPIGKRVAGPLPPPLAEVAARLRAGGWAAALATTHSHEAPAYGGGTLGPRYRIVLPLSRALAPQELRPAAMQLAAALGLSDVVDRSCMEPARLLYLPRYPAEREHLAAREIVDGRHWAVPDALAAPTRERAGTLAAPVWAEKSRSEQAAILRDLRDGMRCIPSDDRETWVKVGHYLKPLGELGFRLWCWWSRKSDQFTEEGLDRWLTFETERSDWRAVFTLAEHEHGWKNPRHPANLDGSKIGFGQGELGKLPPGASPVPLQAQPVAALPEQPPFRRVHLADLATRHIPPHRHFLGPYLPAGEVTLLTGHGGAGKSTLALCIACALATGTAFLGVPAAPAVRVLVFSAEDPAEVLARRVQRLCLHLGLDPAALDANLTVLDATGGDPSLFEEDRNDKRGKPTPAHAALRRELDAGQFDVLIVDNASDVYAGNEIERRPVRAFVRHLADLVRGRQGAVLLLAHVDKNTSRSGARTGDDEGYSGSTAWHNSARCRLFLAPTDNGLELRHQKSNYGPLAPPLRLVMPAGLPVAAPALPDPADVTRELVELVDKLNAQGMRLAPSLTGSYSAAKALHAHADCPKGQTVADIQRLLERAESVGQIQQEDRKDGNRKRYCVWTKRK
jgi:energy-coupling factor transporter ATP-binding protein EcfA2